MITREEADNIAWLIMKRAAGDPYPEYRSLRADCYALAHYHRYRQPEPAHPTEAYWLHNHGCSTRAYITFSDTTNAPEDRFNLDGSLVKKPVDLVWLGELVNCGLRIWAEAMRATP